jgi:DNA modification methylase
MEKIKLLHGDCLELMKKLESNCIDLTVTSPPYDNLRTYNGYSFDFEGIAKELYRITKDGGVIVWVVGDATINGSESGTSFKQALYFKEIGFNLHDTMIWEKASRIPTQDRYYNVVEYMFILSKGKPKTMNFIVDHKNITAGAKRRKDKVINKGANEKYVDKWITSPEYSRRSNIWKYGTSGNGTKHPAIFPEQLANDHIISWSNEGDTVLDCFLGSGTTGKMAVQLNRNFIGMEISSEYLDIAKKRINDALIQPKLF